MILNILSILMLLVITMLWGIRGKGRGLFSSMLTFLCVLIAGGIAIGFWEVISTKVFLGWREDLAWGLGLALPFAISLALLRLIVELSIPKNVKIDDLTNFIGGAVFGFGSGVITVGIVVMSLGSINFGPDFLGYQPIEEDNGDLVHAGGLWVPVDAWTAGIYEHLSIHSFGAGPNALAYRQPEVHEQVSMNRLVFTKEATKGRQIARNGIAEGDARVVARYAGDDLNQFNSSTLMAAPPVNPRTPDDKTFDSTKVEGFVIEFQPGTREKGGQFVIGPGQIRLVYRTRNGVGSADGVHPHAIISEPEADAGFKTWFPRNTKNWFVPSVGGESRTVMGFEFAIPNDAVPTDLIIKNMRYPLDPAEEVRTFASGQDRDIAIRSGELFAGANVTPVGNLNRSLATPSNQGVSTSNRLGNNRIINVTTGVPGTLDLSEESRDGKVILTGRAEFLDSQLLNNRGLARNNRADAFGAGADTGILQIELANNGNFTPMGDVVATNGLNGRPYVIDSQGRAYDAIGYVYSNGVRTYIQFEPGSPLAAMAEIEDQLSNSARDQTLSLIFRPTSGVTIVGFAIGETLVGEFTETIR